MKKSTALITGITGQAGSHLAELLLAKNYMVYGLIRRAPHRKLKNIGHLTDKIEIIEGDITDSSLVTETIRLIKPDETYSLAAQSHVGHSFKTPHMTTQVNYVGVLNLLEAIRLHSKSTKLVHASTSEMFGGLDPGKPYDELSPFHPRSPYGVSKVAAHHLVINYREAYDLFACCAIFFNMEGKRRGYDFVTRKATISAAAIKLDMRKGIGFGNLDTYRDWGDCSDYMEGMYLILQQDSPDEFVFASGETHSIREMLEIVFKHAGLGDYQNYVYIDPRFYRPADVNVLIGNSSKARNTLDWEPKISFKKMICGMYDNDLKELSSKKD